MKYARQKRSTERVMNSVWEETIMRMREHLIISLERQTAIEGACNHIFRKTERAKFFATFLLLHFLN